MLELEDIKKFFPEEVHGQSRAMVREYLQVKIFLESIKLWTTSKSGQSAGSPSATSNLAVSIDRALGS